MKEIVKKIILKLYPELDAGLFTPKFAVVTSVPDAPETDSISDQYREYIAVNVRLLDHHMRIDEKIEEIKSVPVGGQISGNYRGTLQLPEPGNIVEIAYAYGKMTMPFIRTVLPYHMSLCPTESDSTVLQHNINSFQECDRANNWTRETDSDILDHSNNHIIEAIKYVKKIAGNKVGFQIEIKNNPDKPNDTATPAEYAAALYKVLKDENIIDRSEIQAFDWRCLIELNKLDSNIKTAYLTDHTTETLTDSETGLWMAGLKPKDFNYSFPQMVKHLGGYCWEPFIEDLTKEQLDEAHKLGIKVVPWGWVEEEKTDFNTELILKMIDWKVDGIIADRPDMLRGILASRNFNVPEGFVIEN